MPLRLRYLLRKIRNYFSDSAASISYSQEGEDMILARIFEQQRSGFYVDVGAHHPRRFSNTFRFYKLGWKGINIDALPGSMAEFRLERPRDINLELAIASEHKVLTYYMFNDPALNTLDANLAAQRDAEKNHYALVDHQDIQTYRLDEVFSQYLPSNVRIDFMSIDVEGFDLQVLQSNDWEHYRPKYVLVEELLADMDLAFASDTFRYLSRQEYGLVAKTINTLFFHDRHLCG